MKVLNRILELLHLRGRRAEKKAAEKPGLSVIVPPDKAKDARNLEGTKLADCPLMSVCSGLT